LVFSGGNRMEQTNIDALWTSLIERKPSLNQMLTLYGNVPDFRLMIADYLLLKYLTKETIEDERERLSTNDLANILSVVDDVDVLEAAKRHPEILALTPVQIQRISLYAVSADIAVEMYRLLQQKSLLKLGYISMSVQDDANEQRSATLAMYKHLMSMVEAFELLAIMSNHEKVRQFASGEILLLLAKSLADELPDDELILLSDEGLRRLRIRIQFAAINVYSACPDAERREYADCELQRWFYSLHPQTLLAYATAMDVPNEAIGIFNYAFEGCDSPPPHHMLAFTSICARTKELAHRAFKRYLAGEMNLDIVEKIAREALFISVRRQADRFLASHPQSTLQQLNDVIRRAKVGKTADAAMRGIARSAEACLEHIFDAFNAQRETSKQSDVEKQPDEPDPSAQTSDQTKKAGPGSSEWNPIIFDCMQILSAD